MGNRKEDYHFEFEQVNQSTLSSNFVVHTSYVEEKKIKDSIFWVPKEKGDMRKLIMNT